MKKLLFLLFLPSLVLAQPGQGGGPFPSGGGGVGGSATNAIGKTNGVGFGVTVVDQLNATQFVGGFFAGTTFVGTNFTVTNGAFIGNGAVLTNIAGGAPWLMPLIGNHKAQLIDYATTCDATHPKTNLFLSSGAGVVTKIRMVYQGGAASAYAKLTNVLCHIAYDGGADQVNVPWVYFLGLFDTNRLNLVTTKLKTPFINIADVRSDILDFDLTYPIPFTNGITIWTTSSLGVSIASSVHYQDTSTTTALSSMRFMTTNVVTYMPPETLPAGTVAFTAAAPTAMVGTGTHFDATNVNHYILVNGIASLEVAEPLVTAVTDATHATVSWGTSVSAPITVDVSGLAWMIPTEYIWLNRAAGKVGFVAGVTGYATNWLVYPNTRWFLNGGSTPSAEFWDTEQFFGGNNGFAMEPYQSGEVGQISISDDDKYWAGYRLFYNNWIRYNNGCKMMVNHEGDDMSGFPSAGNTFPSLMNFFTVFYE